MTARPAHPVTTKPKRYISVCAQCGEPYIALRSDALFCSGRCRVAGHRHPGPVARLRAIARGLDVLPGRAQQCAAIQAMRPDIADEIEAGTLTIDQAQERLVGWLEHIAAGEVAQ